MFATSARIVPDSAFAWRELSFTLNSRRFSTRSIFTCGDSFCVSVPSGPLTEISSWLERHFDLVRHDDRDNSLFWTSIRPSIYATMHSTSPPTPRPRALRSVITPLDVDTIATPRPFMTFGMSRLGL